MASRSYICFDLFLTTGDAKFALTKKYGYLAIQCYSYPMSEQGFEWDKAKNQEDFRKHGVTFYEAQHAFLDSNRVIAEDLDHSQSENRYDCFGLNEQGNGILTVRFTYRSSRIRIFGAGYWRKGKKSMSKTIQYSDEPLGDLKLIHDFLPSPEDLALKQQNTKITISLSSESVAYFKETAKIHPCSTKK